MKILLSILILSTYLFASPKWIYNSSHKSYEIIGYGIDKNLQVARNIAKSEIAEVLMVKISTNTSISTSDVNGVITKSSNSKLLSSTNSILQGVIVVKEEFIDNHWYVAVKYDNRTLLQKIQIKNPTFTKSDLKDITNLNLVRKNSNWYIKVENDLYFFSNQNFIDIFLDKNHNDLFFQANKKIYLSKDKMEFKINSKDKGFVSILYSEENGKVGIIASNVNIKNKINYPLKNSKKELITYNPTSRTLSELYICIYSKNRLNLNKFEKISSNTLDESNYNFNKLLEVMNKNIFSTIKIKIKANNVKK